METYRGRVPGTKQNYGWIDIASVTKHDGTPHDIKTVADIYLHKENCRDGIWENMEVEFSVCPDEKRGDGTFRAFSAKATEASKLGKLSKKGVELNLQGMDQTRVLDNSSVFATWCLSPKTAGAVKENRLRERAVQLLVVWWPVGRRTSSSEQRKLVNLSDPMTVLGFKTHGPYRIVALVVSDEGPSYLENRYLSKESGRYRTDVISRDDANLLKDDRILGHDLVEAEIPEELFAGKPFDWDWVNFMFKNPPRDQCAYRWRRAFAYSVQPVGFMFLMFLLGVVGTIKFAINLLSIIAGLSIGLRNLNYKGLRHPIATHLLDVFDGAGRSVFIPKVRGKSIPLPIAFSPIVFLAVAGLATIGGGEIGTGSWFLTFFKIFLLPLIAFTIITGIVLWYQSVDWDAIEERQNQAERERLAKEVDELVCLTTGPRQSNVWQLPLNRKTFRFYATAVKQKVCKGFAA